jgi:5-formyltetrahydrofolate cyclo-ligase
MIQQKLLARNEYHQAGLLALYSPIRNEVRTAEIFSAARSDGKRVCFPRVKDCTLEFVEVDSLEMLKPGAFGVAEPEGSLLRSISEVDLMIVPGVGFDRHGYRLGYGQGYYDRVFSSGRPKVTAGLAYEFQVVEKIPKENHDVSLDLLVMDTEVIEIH